MQEWTEVSTAAQAARRSLLTLAERRSWSRPGASPLDRARMAISNRQDFNFAQCQRQETDFHAPESFDALGTTHIVRNEQNASHDKESQSPNLIVKKFH